MCQCKRMPWHGHLWNIAHKPTGTNIVGDADRCIDQAVWLIRLKRCKDTVELNTSWWLNQPIWNILYRQIGENLPRDSGENFQNIWMFETFSSNHHLIENGLILGRRLAKTWMKIWIKSTMVGPQTFQKELLITYSYSKQKSPWTNLKPAKYPKGRSSSTKPQPFLCSSSYISLEVLLGFA